MLYDSRTMIDHVLHVTSHVVALNAERDTILAIVWLARFHDLEDN
jgi:hypothetical protein